jgi:restriction endonuclease Mrr
VSEDFREGKVLDNISGYEFEDVMAEVFDRLGYEDVSVSERTADKGKDLTMRTSGGIEVVVECKHTKKVSRPVVQKLHSAATTHSNGPTKGIVVTSGEFTSPAEEYAKEVSGGGGTDIELIDGDDLREIGDEVGLDLYSGKVEILCDECLPPPRGDTEILEVIKNKFEDIDGFDWTYASDPDLEVEFVPSVYVEARINAVFETSVGVVNRIQKTDRMVLDGRKKSPKEIGGGIADMVRHGLHDTEELDKKEYSERLQKVTFDRYGTTKNEYVDSIKESLCRQHTETVKYTGDNNVTYSKTCEPSEDDVEIVRFEPIYVPRVKTSTPVKEYVYPFSYYASGSDRLVEEDGIHKCVHSGSADSSTYYFCRNCGSISSRWYVRTERLEGDRVCTGCAVTERFFLRKRYFYSEENLEEFRQEYEDLPLYKKPFENKPLVFGVVLGALVLFAWLLMNGGF